MSKTTETSIAAEKTDRGRRSLLAFGWVTALLAGLHLIDHALRGDRVESHGLPAAWDHSGWPFQSDVTPYTFSLFAVTLILGFGLWGTHRGRLWAGYWLVAAIILGTIVTVVHFLPTPKQESPDIIYNSWEGKDALGILAVAVTFCIVVALIGMAVNAVRVASVTGRWT